MSASTLCPRDFYFRLPNQEQRIAGAYVREGYADYQLNRAKVESLVGLHNYRQTGRAAYLHDAIRATRLALSIHQLTK